MGSRAPAAGQSSAARTNGWALPPIAGEFREIRCLVRALHCALVRSNSHGLSKNF
jgi:hypothetical protein